MILRCRETNALISRICLLQHWEILLVTWNWMRLSPPVKPSIPKMRASLDEATDPWGIKVNRVELKTLSAGCRPGCYGEADESRAWASRSYSIAEGQKKLTILVAEGKKQSAILDAEVEKQAAILRAEAQKERMGSKRLKVRQRQYWKYRMPMRKVSAWSVNIGFSTR